MNQPTLKQPTPGATILVALGFLDMFVAACLALAGVVAWPVAVRASLFTWAALLTWLTAGVIVDSIRAARAKRNAPPPPPGVDALAGARDLLAKVTAERQRAEALLAAYKAVKAVAPSYVVLIAAERLEPGDLVVVEGGKARRASPRPIAPAAPGEN